MDLRPSPDQELLRETARQALERRFPLDTLAGREAAGDVDEASWQEMANLGWLGLGIPEDQGGSGGRLLDLAIVCEELGRALCPAPFLPVAVAGGALLEACSSPEAEALLKEMVAGSVRPVPAVADTTGRWRAEAVGVRSIQGRVSGTAHFVEGASAANGFLVVADRSGTAVLAWVAASDERVALTRQRSMAGHHWGRLDLSAAPASTLAVGWEPVRAALSRVGAMQAAWCAGAAARLLEDTVQYASGRVQFGVPIGSFQAVQHRLADCALATAEATTLGRKAADLLDRRDPTARRMASTAFVRATAGFVAVARSCHQVWGGMGFSTETAVHHFSRRAKVAQHQWGGAATHLAVIAEELVTTPLLIDRYRAVLGAAAE